MRTMMQDDVHDNYDELHDTNNIHHNHKHRHRCTHDTNANYSFIYVYEGL